MLFDFWRNPEETYKFLGELLQGSLTLPSETQNTHLVALFEIPDIAKKRINLWMNRSKGFFELTLRNLEPLRVELENFSRIMEKQFTRNAESQGVSHLRSL